MSTHNICFLRVRNKKTSIFRQVILVGQVDFYHLLVNHGQIVKFDMHNHVID